MTRGQVVVEASGSVLEARPRRRQSMGSPVLVVDKANRSKCNQATLVTGDIEFIDRELVVCVKVVPESIFRFVVRLRQG